MRLLLPVATGALAWMLIAAASMAQGQQQTLFEQALSAKLSQEINTSLVCSVTQLNTQKELDAAKARIKELEAQSAPK